MKILDSNIIIYSYQPAFSFLKPLVIDPDNAMSAISRLEVLGYSGIQPGEETYCEYVFRILQQFTVDEAVLAEAIRLRKHFKLKLGDSIVAATALLQGAELQTRNVADFLKIPELVVVNPIP
jgi:predicted nucleic acid-binding protein